MLQWSFVSGSTNGADFILLDASETEHISAAMATHSKLTSKGFAQLVLVLPAQPAVLGAAVNSADAVMGWPHDVLQARSMLSRLHYLLSNEEGSAPTLQAPAPGQQGMSIATAIADEASYLSKLPIDIVLRGETGTGKDTLANYIHRSSGRKGNFVHLNFAAIPDALFEAELFGVEEGAYTGATRTKQGKLELANLGTLYLDEIDSLSLLGQAKLLTALQYRGAYRLGGNEHVVSDFRLIVSTKRPLIELVTDGSFRADLYYRLQVAELELPALRRIRDQLLPAFHQLVKSAAVEFGLPVLSLESEYVASLLAHNWPGNWRELCHEAQRFVLGRPALASSSPKDNGSSLRDILDAVERGVIRQEVTQHQGDVKAAAAALGLAPHSLYYRVKKLGLNDELLQG